MRDLAVAIDSSASCSMGGVAQEKLNDETPLHAVKIAEIDDQ